MRALLVFCFLGSISCTHATPMDGPTGEPLIYIECNGRLNCFNDCLKRAARECPSGYRRVSSKPAYVGDRSITISCNREDDR